MLKNPETDSRRPTVELDGVDGNAYAVTGAVMTALKNAGYTLKEVDQYRAEAMSGSYDELLQISMRWADCE